MSDEQVPPPPDTPPPPPSDAPPPPPPSAAPPPPPGSGKVSENRTIMIVLSYIGPLGLFPFLTEKDDAEVQWHAKHGLVLFGVEVVLFVLATAVNVMAGGCLTCIAYPIMSLAVIAFHIACIVKGTQGERLKIPGLSDLADKF